MNIRVIFGYNIDSDLNRTFFGPGSSDKNPNSPTEGEVIAFINFEGTDYLVSRVTKTYGNSKSGMIDVKQIAMADSGGYYSTNSPSDLTMYLNKLLNSKWCSGKITDCESIIRILSDFGYNVSESSISNGVDWNSSLPLLITSVNNEHFLNVLHQNSGAKRRQ